jgi:hypothetical protein
LNNFANEGTHYFVINNCPGDTGINAGYQYNGYSGAYFCRSIKLSETVYVDGGYLYSDSDKNITCVKSNMRNYCPYPKNFDFITKQCIDSSGSVLSFNTVANEKEPRPLNAEGDGKSNLMLIAIVSENGAPKSGMNIKYNIRDDRL